MGDGGVACVPSQHVMEKFSICGEGNTMLNSSPKSSTTKMAKVKVKMKPKNDKESGFGSTNSIISNKEGGAERNVNGKMGEGTEEEEEVEEGELGTLPFENGEFFPDKPLRRYDIKSETEKCEFTSEKWRKGGCESERGDRRSYKHELETGEFVPDRWGRSDVSNRTNDGGYTKSLRYDTGHEKRRRIEREWTLFSSRGRGWKAYHDSEKTQPSRRERGWKADRDWSPPSGKERGLKSDREGERMPPSSGKYSREKDVCRNVGSNQHSRRYSFRYETEKIQKISSKIVGEEVSVKHDSCSTSHNSSRLKHCSSESDNGGRKNYADYDDCSSSRNRKIFGSCLSPDHSSAGDVERPDKPAAFASSKSLERYSSRYLESSRVLERDNGSSRHSEWSPHDRAHDQDHSSARRFTPSYDQGSHYDRSRSPYCDNGYRSPCDHGLNGDGRDRTSTFPERSPHDGYRETNKKAVAGEKRASHLANSGKEGKHNLMNDSGRRESQFPVKQSPDGGNFYNRNISSSRTATLPSHCKELSQCHTLKNVESSQENCISEEPASMEEDMDICDTPPHVPQVVDEVAGKWYYLDHSGVACGPSKLSDLKTLLNDGYIVSDHLVKHLDSDRWVTVEKAVSPLVTMNYHSVVPDTVTQLVCPLEAPGNLLADKRNDVSGNEEMLAPPSRPKVWSEDKSTASMPAVDFHIEDRVGALLEGVTLIPGKEVEILCETLEMAYEPGEWERWIKMEGFTRHPEDMNVHFEYGGRSEHKCKGTPEPMATAPASFEEDNALPFSNISESFSNQSACKGGDWKRNEEAAQDRTWMRKLVLSDGYPLCLMPKSVCEDPRWEQKDELYYPSQSRRLDLPLWAFMLPEELNDPSCLSRSTQSKSALVRGISGTMLSVVRINACVLRDHGSLISESRVNARGKERPSSRCSQTYSSTGDMKRLLEDNHCKISHGQDSQDSRKTSMPFSIPKDHICKLDELKLHLGDWYFLDGAGQEHGPLLFPDLQVMAGQGIIQKHSSVYRKRNNIWVPVMLPIEPSGMPGLENNSTYPAPLPEASDTVLNDSQKFSSGFHGLHPQFIGYTLGKLHELVMKSYKSREFAASINEVLDPWINAWQSKKEVEKHIYLSDDFHTSKRARIYGIEEYGMQGGVLTYSNSECEFEDLCGDVTYKKLDDVDSEGKKGRWDLLDGNILGRIFHFLRADPKSLWRASLTCNHWWSVVKFYKDISTQVDFHALASNCSDSMILKIMNDYKKEKITTLILCGCTGVSAGVLEEVLLSFPSLSSIDIRGCTQLENLVCKFPNISWVMTRGPHLNFRNLNNLTNQRSSASGQLDDSRGLTEYLESSEKRDSGNQLFRRSLYKRSKLFDARKSSSILSRDAQLRRLAIKKTGNVCKRMEEYIITALEGIMSENTFVFFEPKAAEIVQRLRNGYYARCGLTSIKVDISRMCREAIKIKNPGDGRGMNRIVTMFIELATSLDKGPKLAHARDKIMSSWREDSPPWFSSVSSKYKRSIIKVSERKHLYRSNGEFMNGILYSEDYASDHEIRRRLSKLNKKSLWSGSDASDKSSDASVVDGMSSSDTDSDLESQSEGVMSESKREAYLSPDGGFDSFPDEREWGARMTKASLVPPVTRKYEVIDHYVIVADEEEVGRKMLVSLPEDYAEKLRAQRNCTEESDMEIPEVKVYKPRKSLGHEVIEQEVYGIDPYTHNLLLDSIPDASDWSLLDKHIFIEEVLLRSLNKKVRKFTGCGNTPMTYQLKCVVEEILETAEENGDRKNMRICQFILDAIDSRPEDKYVAYRKGLGVVCNKEGGFTEDDFVVEFLGEVYPTWKWFEKQDGIRALQNNNNDPAPEFYNIYLERPKGDADGYDLVVVDAMHKANYASRICHSCRPNCEAKVTAVDGQYQIGIYSLRPIAYGEEITFDYNSVTESKEEYEASVCLCGSQVCRGSYLNLTGEEAFQKVLKEHHGLLHRYFLLLEACELNYVCEEDDIDLSKAGLGSCLLGGLPDWLIAYAARLVRFINFERMKLPDEIFRYNVEEKKRYFTEINLEVEKSDAEIQAEGVYNQRLQNLALTIDKVKYVMRRVFGDLKNAPPPLERLSPEAAASYLWKGEGSLVEELIHCMIPHVEDNTLKSLKAKIHAHDPSGSDYPQTKLWKSLLWLRDELRDLPCTNKSRHDAAADLIHLYAYTKCHFRIREYTKVTSPPVYITPLDLGPKYADKLRSGVHEYCKTYSETYCLAQLMFWYSQHAEPDAVLAKASRGCLSLPDVGSFYAKVQKPSDQRVYGPRTVKFMLSQMGKHPQKPWPKDRIWSFKNSVKFVGSPMLDAVLNEAPLDKEMVHWLKHRPSVYHASWDR